MVYNALEGCIVDDITKVIRGKTITKEQADAIANISLKFAFSVLHSLP